jgi:hypothetical protein
VDHDTPADETPFQLLVVIVSTREMRRIGLSDCWLVRMIVGSISTGTPKPPDVSAPSAIARDSCSRNWCTARASSVVHAGVGDAIALTNADR